MYVNYAVSQQSVLPEIFSAFALDEFFVLLKLLVASLGVLAQELEVFVGDDVSETQNEGPRREEQNTAAAYTHGAGAAAKTVR